MSSDNGITSKPTGDYALDKVQNPKLLEVAYRAIQNGAHSECDLKETIGIKPKKVDLITTGLQVFNLGGKYDFEFELEPLTFDATTFRNRFRLHILHSVASEARPDDWGMQSAILLNLEYLLNQKTNRFTQTDETLIRDIDNWHIERGYEPQSSKGRRELNRPKFSMWTNQVEYLGLLHSYKDRRKKVYIVRFDPILVLETIWLATEHVGDGNGVGFNEYIDWVNNHIFRIPLSSENSVPKPFARALFELVQSDELRITKSGDPAAVGLPGIPTHDNITKTSNYLKIIS